MGLLHQLTEKPWETAPGGAAVPPRAAVDLPPQQIGLRIFLAVVTILFMLLIIAYAGRMAFETWRPTPQPALLWLNTAFLVAGSLALQWARISARRERADGLRLGLLAGGGFTVAFLAGQVMAWRQLNSLDSFDIANPAIAFFYLITALHGLHMLGGLVAWGRSVAGLWQGREIAELRQGVELCAVYWHFLLVVWLVLFGLLFSGNDSLDILLTICGVK